MRSSCCARWIGLVAIAVVGVVGSTLIGCGAACDTSDDGNPPERYAGGIASGGIYQSSPWGGPLLPFPGGKQYELEHHLGFVPGPVLVYIGFETSDEAVSPCAGNSCIVRRVNDQLIWIQNDTCADFSVRVVASGNVMSDAGAALEAGAALDAPMPDGGDGAATTDAGSLD